ncbi:MAG: hypothetical protein IT449_15940 [Phycisphaerales bacterium]|nr:hypothetical protein [Phycisphaerales bacterium]
MSDSPADRRHRVVHLASGARPRTAPVSAVIASSGLPCTEVFDPYSALAQIARRDRCTPMTIVACLDDLLDVELEFFQLLRREEAPVKVFVYADDRCSALLARLQSEGMFGIGALAGHLERAGQGGEEADPPRRDLPPRARRRWKGHDPSIALTCSPPPAGSAPPAASLPPAVSPAPSSPATPPPPIRRPLPPEASASSRSRVPWMRYNDLPKRTPPRADMGEPHRDARDEPRGEAHADLRLADLALRPADDEPLLTAEELNALLGEVGAGGDAT